jgi:hypothetical protein
MAFTEDSRLAQAWGYYRSARRQDPAFPGPADDAGLAAWVERLRGRREALARGADGHGDGSPAISVVIPVHVHEPRDRFLAALTTLLDNRDCPATEVIIVLNGKVPTAELEASPLCAIGRRVGVRVFTLSYAEDVRYAGIRRPMNIFVPKQYGFEQARGALVLAADIDWVVPAGWIRAYADFFDRHPDVVAAYGPQHFHGATDRLVRLVGWISTAVKAAKILVDFPPFAGHNHALRREIGRAVPGLYEKAQEDCQEVPAIVKKTPGWERSLVDIVRCVPAAASSTNLAGETATVKQALRWFVDSARRNMRNYGRVRRLERETAAGTRGRVAQGSRSVEHE